MQCAFDVLESLRREVQARIDFEEATLEHRAQILAFLRECEAESINYNAPIDDSIDVNAQCKSPKRSAELQNRSHQRDSHEDSQPSKHSPEQTERNNTILTFADDSKNITTHEKTTTKPAGAPRVDSFSLEHILSQAKSIREAKAAKAPGADGSVLGGRAGRSSSSSHSSSRIAAGSDADARRDRTLAQARKKSSERAHASKRVSDSMILNKYHKPVSNKNASLGTAAESVAKAKNGASQPRQRKIKIFPDKKPAQISNENAKIPGSPKEDISRYQPHPLNSDLTETQKFANIMSLRQQVRILEDNPRYLKYCMMRHAGIRFRALQEAPSTELLMSQIQLLSYVQGHTCLPQSAAYKTALQLTPPLGGAQLEQKCSLENICEAAVNVARQARSEFDRHWKNRMENPQSLSLHDKKKLAGLWFTLRVCIDEYDYAMQALKGLVDDDNGNASNKMDSKQDEDLKKSEKLLDMCRKLVYEFPHRGDIAGVALQPILNAFTSRVIYIAESAIGTFAIKDVVRALRKCCELELEDQCSRQQWIEAFRAFKHLYCCLCAEGQDASCCVFLDKEASP